MRQTNIFLHMKIDSRVGKIIKPTNGKKSGKSKKKQRKSQTQKPPEINFT
jgi:hypothetical protein